MPTDSFGSYRKLCPFVCGEYVIVNIMEMGNCGAFSTAHSPLFTLIIDGELVNYE